jgi:nucleotide-binding universal stress UspA family protein
MFKKILVPTDGGPLSERAVDAAIEFAAINGSSIVGLSVAMTYPLAQYLGGLLAPDRNSFEEKAREYAQRNVDELAAHAARRGIACETVTAQSPYPHQEIVDTAAKCQCDAIFMASHAQERAGQIQIGSETQKVLSHSTIPVVVFR